MAVPPNYLEQFDRNGLIALFHRWNADRQAVDQRIAAADNNHEHLKHSIKVHRRWLGFHFVLSIFSIIFIPITEGKSLLVTLGDSLLVWNEVNELLDDRAEMTKLEREARSLRSEIKELEDLLEAIGREIQARDIPT